MEKNKKTLETVVMQQWEESERGWGQRPDGCSLHLDKKSCMRYIEEYWKRMPKEVPDEYERPCGEPYEVVVSKRLYRRIKDADNGLRLYTVETEELEGKAEIKEIGNSKKAWDRISPGCYGRRYVI